MFFFFNLGAPIGRPCEKRKGFTIILCMILNNIFGGPAGLLWGGLIIRSRGYFINETIRNHGRMEGARTHTQSKTNVLEQKLRKNEETTML